MQISDDAVAFIKEWEGYSAKAYFDVTRWSVGYGTISEEGEQITEAEAARRLKKAMGGYRLQLSKRLTFEPTHNQAIALLSAAYNLGCGALDFEIIPLCNKGEFAEAAEALRSYDHAGGKKLSALTRRREAEARLLEVEMTDHGAPRIQYAREYWLMPQDIKSDEVLQVATAAFTHKATIGWSADDAGIGDLDSKTVRLIYPDRHPGGMAQWFENHYPGTDIVYGYPQPAPAPHEPSVGVTGASKFGLHGSADGSWSNPVLTDVTELMQVGRLDAYKALSNESPKTVDILTRTNAELFFCVRLMGKVDSERATASQFLEQCSYDIRQWYDKLSGLGISPYFEIHNEPNLRVEGWQNSWKDGAEFATWWLMVRDALRAECPNALWGFPGLSPGWNIQDVRTAAIPFMEEANAAVAAADWIGVHCYWQTPDMMHSLDGGNFYKRIPHHNVPMLITEFSNPSPDVSKTLKAKQYCEYVAGLEDIKAAFSFIASASSGFDHETWTMDMARIVGQRNGTGT